MTQEFRNPVHKKLIEIFEHLLEKSEENQKSPAPFPSFAFPHGEQTSSLNLITSEQPLFPSLFSCTELETDLKPTEKPWRKIIFKSKGKDIHSVENPKWDLIKWAKKPKVLSCPNPTPSPSPEVRRTPLSSALISKSFSKSKQRTPEKRSLSPDYSDNPPKLKRRKKTPGVRKVPTHQNFTKQRVPRPLVSKPFRSKKGGPKKTKKRGGHQKAASWSSLLKGKPTERAQTERDPFEFTTEEDFHIPVVAQATRGTRNSRKTSKKGGKRQKKGAGKSKRRKAAYREDFDDGRIEFMDLDDDFGLEPMTHVNPIDASQITMREEDLVAQIMAREEHEDNNELVSIHVDEVSIAHENAPNAATPIVTKKDTTRKRQNPIEEDNFCPNCKRRVYSLKRHRRTCNGMKKKVDDSADLDAYLNECERVPVKDPVLYDDNRYLNYDEDDIPETEFSLNFTHEELAEKDWTKQQEAHALKLFLDGSDFKEIAQFLKIHVKKVQSKVEELTCQNISKRRPSRRRKNNGEEKPAHNNAGLKKRKTKKRKGRGRPQKPPQPPAQPASSLLGKVKLVKMGPPRSPKKNSLDKGTGPRTKAVKQLGFY